MRMDTSQDFQKNERRQRKKKLINEVKELLEFYFSPANLKKDNFMNSLLALDEFIDITIFHKFNKIKQLTDQTEILQKAVTNSDILELSEDKQKVKRRDPPVMKDDELECTIYVENIPPNANHDWLKKVFAVYGEVDYISIPRFNTSGISKGFAFIEFKTEQQAQQAVLAFGGLASFDGTLNPSDLLTIKTFGKDPKRFSDNYSTPLSINAEVFVPNPIKRTADEAFEENVEDQQEEDEEEIPEAGTSDVKIVKDEKNKDKGKKKKKRKRMKKEKEYEVNSIYLRVMSKKEWKTLRNRYLDEQKDHMKRLKNNMADLGDYYSKQIHGHGKKKFEEYQEEEETKSNRPEFIADVIVKVILSDELKDAKEFRLGLMHNRSGIQYVDLQEGQTVVHIRFKTADDGKAFLDEKLFENVLLLQDEEESCYWSRIFTLYELRQITKKKKNKKDEPFVPNMTTGMRRGREKLISKALQRGYENRNNRHTVFDD